MHLTPEVFLGNSAGLFLHNLLPGLASLISEEMAMELHTEHIRSFMHLIPCLLGSVEWCFTCNYLGLRKFVTLCLLELFGPVRSCLASSNCLLGSIVTFPLFQLILVSHLG